MPLFLFIILSQALIANLMSPKQILSIETEFVLDTRSWESLERLGMRIGLTYDLRDDYHPYENAPADFCGEFDSEATIDILERTIESLGYEVCKIGNVSKLVHFIVENKSVDLVFNLAEGLWGRSREAQVPAILEAFQIPYTFSDPLTMSICLDKAIAKRLWRQEGLPTPNFYVVSDMSQLNPGPKVLSDFPLFVKPIHEGTSKGISASSIVTSTEELSNSVKSLLVLYRQPVIVENYLSGREFTVGILGSSSKARVLGAVEITIINPEGRVYGFVQKEESEIRVLYKSVESTFLVERLSDLALRAFFTVGCQDAGRVDIRLDNEGRPYLLEINPLPGLHPTHSDLPIIGKQAGIAYEQLIAEIIRSAIERWSL